MSYEQPQAVGLTQYNYVKKMNQLFDLLQDEQSKRIFWARLQFDVDPNMDSAILLLLLLRPFRSFPPSEINERKNWRKYFERANIEGKDIILYGAGTMGQLYANLLKQSNADFKAFCDKRMAGQNSLMKPIISPEELLTRADSTYVIITTPTYYDEIIAYLEANRYPKDHILLGLSVRFSLHSSYFDFLDDIEPGTAFVDCGCFDGSDSIRFSTLTNGNYSKIIAFEPDPLCFKKCELNLRKSNIQRIDLIQSGISNKTGSAILVASANGGSYLSNIYDTVSASIVQPSANPEAISTIALDDMAINTKVGMIKMDIEGAEYDALCGASKTIKRDKPVLAICVYHRKGDMLAIMDLLHSLVPEYRFWLRHDGSLTDDTVLFAMQK